MDFRIAPGWLALAVATLLIGLSLAAGAHAQSVPRNRIVIQVSDADPAKWNLALNNVKNVQEDLGAKNVDIELVAYGPGLGILKVDSVVGNKIADALAAGVSVIACENTMKNQKLTRDDMLPKIGYVPAGVVQLMKRQQQGWAYIRP
jgi:intracellular sulfur oxidation DsrE/DsrF family protein